MYFTVFLFLYSITTNLQKIFSKMNSLELEVKKISQHLSLSDEPPKDEESINRGQVADLDHDGVCCSKHMPLVYVPGVYLTLLCHPGQ